MALLLTEGEVPAGYTLDDEGDGTDDDEFDDDDDGGPFADDCTASEPRDGVASVYRMFSNDDGATFEQSLDQYDNPTDAQREMNTAIAFLRTCGQGSGTDEDSGASYSSQVSDIPATGQGDFAAGLRLKITFTFAGQSGSSYLDVQLVRLGRVDIAVLSGGGEQIPADFSATVRRAVDKARPAA